MNAKDFKSAPWDTKIFGIDCFEVLKFSAKTLDLATKVPGHYTIKVDPLLPKKILSEHGFYYCDTLIEPYCATKRLRGYYSEDVVVTQNMSVDEVLNVSYRAFSHGRFHRDFSLDSDLADDRYDQWLRQLFADGKVFCILYKNKLGGFIAVDNNKLVLHAVCESVRGRSLAKYFWTPVCEMVIKEYGEVESSISVSNLAVLNLYSSLGFSFRKPIDVYHRFTR